MPAPQSGPPAAAAGPPPGLSVPPAAAAGCSPEQATTAGEITESPLGGSAYSDMNTAREDQWCPPRWAAEESE